MTKPTVKTAHADLLNALESMQGSWMYAARRDVLREAELLIVAQERRIRELEASPAQYEDIDRTELINLGWTPPTHH